MAPKKSTQNALASYDAKLAAIAEQYSKTEASAATGAFFSTRGGILSWNNTPLKNNEMAVIIVDSIMENVYYEADFDPDTPMSPNCYAFGRDEFQMVPHEAVIAAGSNISTNCEDCPYNEWASADKGKGKKCRNVRRLAMISAGTLDRDGELEPIEDPEALFGAEVGFMKLPVTSVKNYANYVKTLATQLKRPPFAVYTKVTLVPDAKSQFKVMFEALGLLDSSFIQYAIDKNAAVAGLIEFPYKVNEEEPQPKTTKKQSKRRY